MSAAAIDPPTASMAAVNLNATNGSAAAPTADAISQSAAEGRRLYIGNLAYATKEVELKEFFKAYLVESTSIPTNPKNDRPVGYAFVDLSTPNEAERAVSELNGKTILDRKVSVQLARKPEPAAAAGEAGEDAEGRRRASNRGRPRGRGRGGRAARGGRAEGADDTTEAEGAAAAAPLADTTNQTEGQDTSTLGKIKGALKPRTQRGPPEDGVPSKTKVMVANLPYDMKEEQLLEIFKEYNPTAAKLALRPIPRFMVKKLQQRGEARKGRGFAFVTLASEELQQKAIADMNGKEVEGRELAVKVAIDSPGKEDAEIVPDDAAATGKENGVAKEGEAAPAAA